MKNSVLYVLLAVLSLGIGCGAGYLVKYYLGPDTGDYTRSYSTSYYKTEPVAQKITTPVETPVTHNEYADEEEPQEEPEAETEAPAEAKAESVAPELSLNVKSASVKLGSDTKFSVSGIKVEGSGGPYSYVLYDGTHRYTSDSGNFKGVEPNDKGSYTLKVTDSGTGKSVQKSLSGFYMPVEKMDVNKLVSVLNGENGLYLDMFKDYFVDFSQCRVKCNLDDVKIVRQVSTKTNLGYKATVNSVKYDQSGRIQFIDLTLE